MLKPHLVLVLLAVCTNADITSVSVLGVPNSLGYTYVGMAYRNVSTQVNLYLVNNFRLDVFAACSSFYAPVGLQDSLGFIQVPGKLDRCSQIRGEYGWYDQYTTASGKGLYAVSYPDAYYYKVIVDYMTVPATMVTAVSDAYCIFSIHGNGTVEVPVGGVTSVLGGQYSCSVSEQPPPIGYYLSNGSVISLDYPYTSARTTNFELFFTNQIRMNGVNFNNAFGLLFWAGVQKSLCDPGPFNFIPTPMLGSEKAAAIMTDPCYTSQVRISGEDYQMCGKTYRRTCTHMPGQPSCGANHPADKYVYFTVYKKDLLCPYQSWERNFAPDPPCLVNRSVYGHPELQWINPPITLLYPQPSDISYSANLIWNPDYLTGYMPSDNVDLLSSVSSNVPSCATPPCVRFSLGCALVAVSPCSYGGSITPPGAMINCLACGNTTDVPSGVSPYSVINQLVTDLNYTYTSQVQQDPPSSGISFSGIGDALKKFGDFLTSPFSSLGQIMKYVVLIVVCGALVFGGVFLFRMVPKRKTV